MLLRVAGGRYQRKESVFLVLLEAGISANKVCSSVLLEAGISANKVCPSVLLEAGIGANKVCFSVLLEAGISANKVCFSVLLEAGISANKVCFSAFTACVALCPLMEADNEVCVSVVIAVDNTASIPRCIFHVDGGGHKAKIY